MSSIPSPLIETAFAARTYYAQVRKTTPDGLFTVVMKPLKSITFKDATNVTAVFNFKEPV